MPIECNDGVRVPRPDHPNEYELDCTGRGILILLNTGGPYMISVTDLRSGDEVRTEPDLEFIEAEDCNECPYQIGELVLGPADG